MLETNIHKFIIGGCRDEVNRYNSIFNQPNRVDYDKNQWSYIVEILILTIKSLMPCEANHGTIIDYNRFSEELKLWYYYRHGENKSLVGIFGKDEKAYWEYEDDSLCSRIVPIILANEDWIIGRNEAIKNILFTTGKISSTLEGLAIAKLTYILISNPDICNDELLSQIKEEIVCFSQSDFIRNNAKNFKFSTDTYKKNYSIEFERKRIELLNVLNGVCSCQEYNTLIQSLDILIEPNKEHKNSFFFLGGLKGLKTNSEENDIKDEIFIKNLCDFLLKLRKGRIAVESLKIEKYILTDVFKYKEGDIFFHTLLKKCQVIKKIRETNEVISFIRTKSGIYRFLKKNEN